jgi:anthranilate phosphoribosyltransferase
VLEALGVAIDLGPQGVAECIQQAGVGFMYAPRYHPAMKAVRPVRSALKVGRAQLAARMLAACCWLPAAGCAAAVKGAAPGPAACPAAGSLGPASCRCRRRPAQVRTALNILGPLLNPAHAAYGLVGVYSTDISELMAGALMEVGAARLCVPCGRCAPSGGLRAAGAGEVARECRACL